MAYEFFYEGTPYSLEPGYGDSFTGYRIPLGEIGAPTSIQTANQIQEVSNLLNQGLKPIELQPLNPEVFDQIPKQHFKEISRLQKMTGAKMSVHAPMVEPSGLTKEGWSETDREMAERQLKMVIDKSHELDEKGSIPIVIHSSAIPGTEFSPPSKQLIEDYKRHFKERTGKDPTPQDLKYLNEKKVIAINQDTKQMIPVERVERVYPSDVSGKDIKDIRPGFHSPREELDIHNQSDWDQNLTQVLFYKNRGDEIIETYYPSVKHIWPAFVDPRVSEEKRQEILNAIPSAQRAALDNVRGAYEYVKNSRLILNSLFSKAYKYGTEEERRKLKEAADSFEKKIHTPDVSVQSKAIQELVIRMQDVNPRVYVPIEEFAGDHSSKTFANVAFDAYKKYGSKAPMICIENLFPGMAFSRSEQLKKLVDDSRSKFVEQAVKKGYSKSEAKDAANKMIGVTWDVGHLNMMRKLGYKEDEIVKETERIGKYVKHVHLTDNFGYSDSHLPPGMGNVPIKKILEELEKQGFSGRKIVEAGAFVQHFKIPPTQAVLEAFGSPTYSTGAAPYWNQALGAQGNYFSGYGPILPDQHFSMYGAGFSGMPIELGGQMQGRQSRFSGTPTE